MVIGPSGVQSKSDDREAGARFVNHDYDYRIGRHEVLLPINQNYDRI